jgi:nitrogen fixation NifU-like protein
MSDLRDLYQELILDHQKNPRNFGELPDANHHANGFNPLCGDKISLDFNTDENGLIHDIRFHGSGCAISKASASMMTMALKGKTIPEADALFQVFHHLVLGNLVTEEQIEHLGRLKVFQGIRDYPSRVKCASLPWHTFKAALNHNSKTITTDSDNDSVN